MIRIEAKDRDISPSIIYLSPFHIAEVDTVLERQEGVVVETIYRILMVTGEWFNYRSSEYNVEPLAQWLDWRVDCLKSSQNL